MFVSYKLFLQVPHLYCIGDANGKMMLAHAASAQGISGTKLFTTFDKQN